jgi:hypothetical protein
MQSLCLPHTTQLHAAFRPRVPFGTGTPGLSIVLVHSCWQNKIPQTE